MRIRLGLVLAAVVLGLAFRAGAPAAATVDLILQGKVVDDAGLSQGGVQVKAFINGFERGSAITGGDGSYMLSFRYDEAADQTIVVWWIPALQTQVPELVLLRESSQARALGIWSPCIPRLDLGPSISHDLVIHSEAEKFRLLGEDDCLKQSQPEG